MRGMRGGGVPRLLAFSLCLLAAGLWPRQPAAQSAGNFSTLTTTGPNALGGTTTLSGDALMCSGRPWIDVRCNGAVGDDSHDDTAAIQTTIAAAVTNGWPVRIPAGTYKVSATLTIDYAGQRTKGFRLISDGATIDGAAVPGTVLQIECSGGTPSSPVACYYFREEGTLFVNGNAAAYAVVFGKADFSDQHNSGKIDHLSVDNASTAAGAGACQYNSLYDMDLYQVCVTAGGAAGLALEQTQFSRLSGAATAQGSGGRGLVLEQGYDFSNVFFGLDLEVSPTCLSITTAHNGENTWVGPYFNCNTAVSATASAGNVLIDPNYGGNTVNYGPQSVGITVLGPSSRGKWLFPAASSYTAAPIDDGLSVSSYNAAGAALNVALPALASINQGWSLGLATDNGKGLVVTAPAGASLIYQGKSLASLTLGGGNYEYARVESDGANFRVTQESRASKLLNGQEASPWPSNWLFPSSSGYAATVQDDGNVLSSYNTSGGLTVTLPPTGAIPTGWTLGFATDNAKPLTINVNGAGGGHLLYPGSGGSQTSLGLANTAQGAYEYLTLQYDGGGNFRVVEATPATMQALGVLGSAGITHWSFPSASTYPATVADNGNVISSFNSPSSFLAVTLPSANAGLPMGWTIGLATDSNKAMSVQVNATSGGHILWPGSGAAQTSLSLAAGNYEFLRLSYDGSNFRVVEATPASANAIGMTGAAALAPTNAILFTASGTYTPSPGAKVVRVKACAGGGGGGSGGLQASGTAVSGGGGGGGGSCFERWFRVADLGASVAVTVGAGGAGGTAPTAGNSAGNNGAAGGNTSFGALAAAWGGGYGAGGQLNAASGGGSGGLADVGAVGNASGSTGGPNTLGGFGGGGSGANGASGIMAGQGSGGGGGTGAGVGSTGGSAYSAASGGGSGGGVSAAPAANNGGTAGNQLQGTGHATPAAGGSSATPAGGAGAAPLVSYEPGGGGGGGFGNAAGNAGAGGNGTSGGGGGGGGSALNGATAGVGGAGGNGFLAVTEFF